MLSQRTLEASLEVQTIVKSSRPLNSKEKKIIKIV